MSDRIGAVFAALADATRRAMLEALVREGSTSVPDLSGELPISRQAIAKHVASLEGAGLIERVSGSGRVVRFQLRAGALEPASSWLAGTERGWEQRLLRLKGALERDARPPRERS